MALHELAFVAERFAAATGLATALIVNFLVLRYFVFRRSRMLFVPQLLVYVLGVSPMLKFAVYEGFVFARTQLEATKHAAGSHHDQCCHIMTAERGVD